MKPWPDEIGEESDEIKTQDGRDVGMELQEDNSK